MLQKYILYLLHYIFSYLPTPCCGGTSINIIGKYVECENVK